MPTVDKAVTIRLEARDNLTPSLRRAATEAGNLSTAMQRASAATDKIAASRPTRIGGLVSIAGDAGRVEKSMLSAGAAMRRFNAYSSAAGGSTAGLRGVAGAAAGVEASLTRAGSTGAKSLAGLAGQADRAAASARSARGGFDALQPGLLAIGLGVGAAAKSFMDFDKNMSAVSANTGATGSTLDALRQKAIELGGATQYSGAEAAAGINELAKAGVNTQAVLGGGLQGALSLAASGQMEVADAAETAASAMTQFGLQGSQVPHIADLLASAANAAQGSVHDMGMALNQTGLVARQAGLNIEETVGGLTAFASAGLTGSDAGTSFKTMLQRLNPASKEAKDAMAELGFSAFDSQGNFIGLANVAGKLQESMKGLSTQQKQAYLQTIFGQDAIRGATVLMNAGADGIRKYIGEVDQYGAANRMAAALTDNLSGDIEKLGGAIDSVVLSSGSGLNGTLRSLAQGFTGLIDVAGKIPAPILQIGAGLVALNTASRFLPDLGPRFSGWRDSLSAFRVEMAAQRTGMAGMSVAARELGLSVGQVAALSAASTTRVGGLTAAWRAAGGAAGVFKTAAGGLVSVLGGPWGVALAGAGIALSLFAQRSADAKARQDELKSATDALTGTLVTSSGAWTQDASKQLVQMAGQKNLIENYKNMGYSIASVTSAITQEGSSRQAILGQLDAHIERLREEGTVMTENGPIIDADSQRKIDYYQQQKQNLTDLITVGSQAVERAKLQAAADDAIGTAAQSAAQGTGSLTQATKEAAEAAKAANQAITDLANTVTKGRDAQATYWAAVDETTSKIGQLSGAVLKGGTDFNVQTARGRDAQAQLLKLGNAARDAALQQLDLGKGVGDASKQMDAAKTQFLATAQRMGLNRQAAAQLADQLGLTDVAVRNHAAELGRIPGNVTTRVQVLGLETAISQVSELMRGLRQFDNTSVTAVARVASYGNPFAALQGFQTNARGGLYEAFADGGIRREQHVAQIARAGAWRVWAEDETGGEAYIPLAPGKRARSVAILEEVARRFGMAVTAQARGSILSFASGGVAAGPVRGVTGAGVVGRIAPSALTVPITAVIAKVVPPKTPVPAPFLYTAGGPWDRSKELAKVNASAITEAFKKLFVSKDMVAEALGKLRDARAAAGLSRSDGSVRGVSSVAPRTTAKATATNTTVTRTAASRSGSVNLVNASRAATAQGKAAGAAVVATQAKATAAMRATVAAKTTPASARAAAIANALSMNGRGSYKWGGGHQDGYYRNSAALAADCSGFVGWAIGHALGRNATSTAAGMLGGNKSLGYVRIDPRIAAKTAGAIMGSAGHVVMSLGDGRVVESYKTGKPVRIRKIASRDYSMAAWNSKLGPMTTGTAAQITGGMTGAATGNTQSELNNLAQAQADYARLLAASKIPAYRTFAQTTVATTKVSRAFLANIRKIRDRGFPLVAARLLEMGEDDGGAVAQSFASASTAALRQQTQNYQQNASYEDLRAKLSAELGKVAGPPAWVTASRENATTNAGMATFLANIAKINTRGFGTLAAKLLEMGVEEGGDIARQAVTLTDKDLRNLRGSLVDTPAANAKRAETVLGPRWVQAAQATVKATATSAAFLANIRKIRDRGFPTLALKLMELGEETASGMAAEAATATDKDLRNFRDSYTASEAMQKEADALLDQLKGIGQVLNISVGQSTGTDPQVRWTAPRAVDARAAMPSGWANNVRTVPSGPAVQVTVENMHAANPSEAGTQLETRIGDAVAVSGIGRVI